MAIAPERGPAFERPSSRYLVPLLVLLLLLVLLFLCFVNGYRAVCDGAAWTSAAVFEDGCEGADFAAAFGDLMPRYAAAAVGGATHEGTGRCARNDS